MDNMHNVFNKSVYNNQYTKDHYDRLNIQVPKGKKAEIQAHAKSKGMTLNAYVNNLIDRDMAQNG